MNIEVNFTLYFGVMFLHLFFLRFLFHRTIFLDTSVTGR